MRRQKYTFFEIITRLKNFHFAKIKSIFAKKIIIMKIRYLLSFLFSLLIMNQTFAKIIETDSYVTKSGKKVTIHFIKHASFYFVFNGITIYVDPVNYEGINYQMLPKSDLLLVTHDHYDHLDKGAIENIITPKTLVYGNKQAYIVISQGEELRNGDKVTFKIQNDIIEIEAVPAYNTTEGRDIYHPKNRDNGYVLTLGGSHFYIPGDCEDMPEMKHLKNIDVAFLPINQPYTMTVEQAVNAAKTIKPKILYPIHYGDTDLQGLSVLKKIGIKVKVFQM
jgi:L-ascorbate metabolism protein UlaG (beta-lactamase superfamily)